MHFLIITTHTHTRISVPLFSASQFSFLKDNFSIYSSQFTTTKNNIKKQENPTKLKHLKLWFSKSNTTTSNKGHGHFFFLQHFFKVATNNYFDLDLWGKMIHWWEEEVSHPSISILYVFCNYYYWQLINTNLKFPFRFLFIKVP